eukprot:TRINITY_DN18124_c0_g1_i1.p1 TRINITY_DN18124_c0_g1~~TRINITY_DN18124_c0_g1_i1.p1  ORF type:complete len:255 (+),score=28.92 TRINITY_DN18124_c0_g1_i1:98-862(+)
MDVAFVGRSAALSVTPIESVAASCDSSRRLRCELRSFPAEVQTRNGHVFPILGAGAAAACLAASASQRRHSRRHGANTLGGKSHGAWAYHPRARGLRAKHDERGSLTRREALSEVQPHKTIWFVRHGQAEHNVLYHSGKNEEAVVMLDAELTALGREQARAVAGDTLLAPALKDPEGVELVVASPLRRTVETALLAVGDWLSGADGRRLYLHPDFQEISREVQPCNTGSPVEALKQRFQGDSGRINFSGVLWFV